MGRASPRRRRGAYAWLLLGVTALVPLAACRGSKAAADGEALPGRSRPLLVHDWTHPRDFKFDPGRFSPPDPAAALVTTSSGVRAYVIGQPEDRTVRITAALPLGRLFEQTGEAGATGFVVSGLRRVRSADALRALATDLSVQERSDVTTVSIEVLPEDWPAGLALVIDQLRSYSPDLAALRAYKTGPGYFRQTARIDDGGAYRPRVELERLLGGYPLAPPQPDLTVSPDAVRGLLSRSIAANLVVLGIGGPVDRSAVSSALEELTKGWAPGSGSPQRARMEGSAPAQRMHAIDAPTLEGWVAIGRAVGPVPEAERAPVAVMADVLSTRLNIAAREIRGLANRTIFELPEQADGGGLMRMLTGGRHEAVGPLVKVCLDEAARFHSSGDGVTDDELMRSKGAVILSTWQGSLDGAGQASATYAVETVRTGGTKALLAWPAAVNAVTREQVKQVATKYLDPKEFTAVVIGPLEQIAQARHPRWPTTLEELGFH